MTQEKQEQLYKTTSLWQSSWLRMCGMKFVGIDKSRPRMVFMLEDCDDREKYLKEFWENTTVQKFIGIVTDMKNEMYSDNPPIIFDRNKVVTKSE